MAEMLDPLQVLRHLNDMGFYNITAQQLKEFIYDLKKLIKHDLQKQKDSKDASVLQRDDLYDYLYKTSTTSFKAKCAKKKKEYVPMPQHMKKPSSMEYCYEKNKRKSMITPDSSIECESMTTKISDKMQQEEHSNHYENPDEKYLSHESLCTESIDPRLINFNSDSNIAAKRTKSKAFIRPRFPKKPINKSDPVALYHSYQLEWNKFKNQMPGQSNRNSLRWNIREKMMGRS